MSLLRLILAILTASIGFFFLIAEVDDLATLLITKLLALILLWFCSLIVRRQMKFEQTKKHFYDSSSTPTRSK